MILIEKISRSGKPGIGGRADDNLEIGEPVLKLLDYCFGRVHFSDADGMKPDTFLFRASPADPAETLGPAGTVATMPDGPIYDHGTVNKSGK